MGLLLCACTPHPTPVGAAGLTEDPRPLRAQAGLPQPRLAPPQPTQAPPRPSPNPLRPTERQAAPPIRGQRSAGRGWAQHVSCPGEPRAEVPLHRPLHGLGTCLS